MYFNIEQESTQKDLKCCFPTNNVTREYRGQSIGFQVPRKHPLLCHTQHNYLVTSDHKPINYRNYSHENLQHNQPLFNKRKLSEIKLRKLNKSLYKTGIYQKLQYSLSKNQTVKEITKGGPGTKSSIGLYQRNKNRQRKASDEENITKNSFGSFIQTDMKNRFHPNFKDIHQRQFIGNKPYSFIPIYANKTVILSHPRQQSNNNIEIKIKREERTTIQDTEGRFYDRPKENPEAQYRRLTLTKTTNCNSLPACDKTQNYRQRRGSGQLMDFSLSNGLYHRYENKVAAYGQGIDQTRHKKLPSKHSQYPIQGLYNPKVQTNQFIANGRQDMTPVALQVDDSQLKAHSIHDYVDKPFGRMVPLMYDAHQSELIDTARSADSIVGSRQGSPVHRIDESIIVTDFFAEGQRKFEAQKYLSQK